MGEDEDGDVGAGDFSHGDAGKVGEFAEPAGAGTVGERSGADEGPVEAAFADEVLLAVLVVVDFAEQEGLNDSVVEEAAVPAAVSCSDSGDADQARDSGLLHGGNQVAGAGGEEGGGLAADF